MQVALFIMLLTGAIISGANLMLTAPSEKPALISNAEVTDLIARLAPLTSRPDARYGDLQLVFWQNGVEIKLHAKNGNEYHGVASDLHSAVARIADPAAEIREALQGWGEK